MKTFPHRLAAAIRPVTKSRHRLAAAVLAHLAPLALVLAPARPAFAQMSPAPGGGGGAGGAAGPAGGSVTVGQPLPSPQPGGSYVPVGAAGYGNPESPNGTIGGGNATESSAHPVTGDQEDGFDLRPGAGAGGAAHGSESGPVFSVAPQYSGGEVPGTHVVRHGDTLWGIGDYYFKNPYEWPKLWSYNPQIKNPNWIYPGDEVHLKAGAEGGAGNGGAGAAPPLPYANGGNLIDRRRQVPNDTVFLRDQGWIRDDTDEVWGDVTGSASDKMFLSDFDELYLHIDPGHDVRIGQELTVFRPVHPSSATGAIIMIEGTARIDAWNSRDRVARAQLVESLNVVERGAKIGPITRRFEVVPPQRNETEVVARVLASVHPNEFYGQNQVLFIDKGESAGLKAGNRLFILRRGDPWRHSLVEPSAGDRVSPDDEKPMPPMERTPGSRTNERAYPDEVVGELRVVATKKESATCVVTQSTVEIERFDVAVARKGY
ncbi:MAG: LysM peptidoglycan-binding domain-containing protein [Myxococcales bacterium]|nr:LysM peptidoglycan-binding domain-containing protein [Myxococcales bacterium]